MKMFMQCVTRTIRESQRCRLSRPGAEHVRLRLQMFRSAEGRHRGCNRAGRCSQSAVSAERGGRWEHRYADRQRAEQGSDGCSFNQRQTAAGWLKRRRVPFLPNHSTNRSRRSYATFSETLTVKLLLSLYVVLKTN